MDLRSQHSARNCSITSITMRSNEAPQVNLFSYVHLVDRILRNHRPSLGRRISIVEGQVQGRACAGLSCLSPRGLGPSATDSTSLAGEIFFRSRNRQAKHEARTTP